MEIVCYDCIFPQLRFMTNTVKGYIDEAPLLLLRSTFQLKDVGRVFD